MQRQVQERQRQGSEQENAVPRQRAVQERQQQVDGLGKAVSRQRTVKERQHQWTVQERQCQGSERSRKRSVAHEVEPGADGQARGVVLWQVRGAVLLGPVLVCADRGGAGSRRAAGGQQEGSRRAKWSEPVVFRDSCSDCRCSRWGRCHGVCVYLRCVGG